MSFGVKLIYKPRRWQTPLRLLGSFQQSRLELSTVSHNMVINACVSLSCIDLSVTECVDPGFFCFFEDILSHVTLGPNEGRLITNHLSPSSVQVESKIPGPLIWDPPPMNLKLRRALQWEQGLALLQTMVSEELGRDEGTYQSLAPRHPERQGCGASGLIRCALFRSSLAQQTLLSAWSSVHWFYERRLLAYLSRVLHGLHYFWLRWQHDSKCSFEERPAAPRSGRRWLSGPCSMI